MILARRSSVIGARIEPSNTPIQQVKGAGLSARGQTTQGLPQPLRNLQIAVVRRSTIRTMRITFTQNPSDPYFVTAKVYVRYLSDPNPTLMASGTSPVTVNVTATRVPAIIFVVSSGNWGDCPISFSDSKVVNLA